MTRLTKNAFTQPKNPFPHPDDCPSCAANREAKRADLLDKGYSEEDADRMSAVALRPELSRVFSCGWVE